MITLNELPRQYIDDIDCIIIENVFNYTNSANKEMNKAIQLKAQRRYENPVYKRLKKYEHYVTANYVDNNLGYESVIDTETASCHEIAN